MSEHSSGPGVLNPTDPQSSLHDDGARQALLAVRQEVAKAVVGQDATVTGLLIALLS
ncbi:MAG: AAA family ATPase, partial [Actinomycetes bacterium]